MGIFSNPSEVPIPGPPPKKETVRIELAGCGNLCGEVVGPAVLPCPTCDASVWSTVSTSTKTIGWVWFTLCCCCCLGCSFLPFCVNDFKKTRHFCPTCGTLLKTETNNFNKKQKGLIVTLLIFQVLFFLCFIYMWMKYIGLV